MAILKNFLYICLPAAVLTGCYTDFNPDEYSKPVLCLNSVVTAGSPVSVSVARTWRYNEPVAPADREVKDAVVSIYVNGKLQDSSCIAAEGDEIHLKCESKEYGNADASVTVPYAAPIEKVSFIPYSMRSWKIDHSEFGVELHVSFNFDIEISISDLRPESNYFRLIYDTYSLGHPDGDSDDKDAESETPSRYAYLSSGNLDYNSDMIFKEHIGIAENMFGGYEIRELFFTDRMFSGSSYTISFKFDQAQFYAYGPEFEEDLLDCGIRFTLMSVSRSYYDRMNYLWQKNSGIIEEAADLGLADPIWGYSNVSTGAGVVAAKSVTSYTVSLKDFLTAAIEEAETRQGL